MDFFGSQDLAKKQSAILLVLFVTVLLIFGLLVNTFATVATYYVSDSASPWESTRYSLLLTLTLWLFILIGCWLRYLDVKNGGRKLAERFGASAVLATSRKQADRDLLDVVAEMAVAASLPAPSTYCLRNESSINAFVVGGEADSALVVSQGALDMLNREELQGVVGHEFGHLVNGDLSHNMRLLIALGGLNAIDEIGKKITDSADAGNIFSVNPPAVNYGTDTMALALFTGSALKVARLGLLALGVVLRVIGSLGVLGGNLVRAAFSRQRELLADASSVQFTRNAYALASALDRVEQYGNQKALHSVYSQELAHLCFQVPLHSHAWARVLDTHPSIRERIKAIDPHFSIKARKRSRAEPSGAAVRAVAQGNHTGAASTGKSPALSDRFELFASDQVSCLAILFALFVAKDSARAERYFSAIGFAYNREFKDKVKNIHAILGKELDINKLPIIEYIAPTLGKVSAPNRQRLLLNIEKLVDVEEENSITNFSALQLIRRKLETEIPTLEKVVDKETVSPDKAAPRSITELGKELSLLLSLMVEASGHSADKVLHDYTRVLKCYTNEKHPMRSSKEEGVFDELEQAFHALYQQPLSQRQAFVRHCAEIMQFDGIKMEQEQALLSLFAASLDVPELAVA